MTLLIPQNIQPVYPEALPGGAIRERLLELLGVVDPPERLEYEIELAEETSEGLRLSHVAYSNSIGEMVPAILSVPASNPALGVAGIVCLPGTSGSAERLTHAHFRRKSPGFGPLLGWGRELARQGFATLSISVKGCDARRSRHDPELQAKAFGPYGYTRMGVAVDEVLRGARVLSNYLSAECPRIGLAGMSLGGNATWYAMACAPWISAAVPVCGGLGSMATFIQEGDMGRHGSYYFVPHLLRYFDHPEIVTACIAPRPFMMIAPTMDEDMPRSGVEKLMEVVGPAYAAAGYPERFHVYRPETNHEFRVEFFEKMATWFERFLRTDGTQSA